MTCITTPAMAEIMGGVLLTREAYLHADRALVAEGVDPLACFADPELQRHHHALGMEFRDQMITTDTIKGENR